MSSFDVAQDGVIWRGDGETLYMQAWGSNSLRVRSTVMGDILDTEYSLLAPDRSSCEVSVDGSVATVRNGKITASITAESRLVDSLQYTVHTCHIKFLDSTGRMLLEEQEVGGALCLKARDFRPHRGGGFHLSATFSAEPSERLHGMGQYQQGTFDLKGASLELAHRNSQASVPFVLSSEGYGFLWHNPAIGEATFATNKTVWEAESTGQLDYWITAGDTPAEIAAAYADVTGHTPRMPDYGLGFWQSKLRYSSQEQLMDVAREYHRRGIPLDVIVADFFHWPKMGDFRFDPEFWPDPKSMVEELNELGTELMVSVWPQISYQSENFDEMKSRNLTVRTERGIDVQMAFQGPSVFADMTNPATREYVWDLCKKNYFDLGVKMFRLYEAEPEYGTYHFDNYRYYQGSNLEVGNLYPQAYARGFFEGQKRTGQEEIVNLLRCAWSGSQRFGALAWSGDIQSTWTDLRNQVVAGMHMGIAGIPWYTTDIGGFFGGSSDDPEFRELLVRWFQFGAFCPVMRMHGYREPRTPITDSTGEGRCDTGADNEVWSFGEEVEEILTKYILAREALRPYLRRTMDHVHDVGGPVMRPLFYEFPDDECAWSVSDQYMLGEDLLVAPVLEAGAKNRSVYLPAGADWRNLNDGLVYDGGQRIVMAAPIDAIPVFARGDALTDLHF